MSTQEERKQCHSEARNAIDASRLPISRSQLLPRGTQMSCILQLHLSAWFPLRLPQLEYGCLGCLQSLAALSAILLRALYFNEANSRLPLVWAVLVQDRTSTLMTSLMMLSNKANTATRTEVRLLEIMTYLCFSTGPRRIRRQSLCHRDSIPPWMVPKLSLNNSATRSLRAITVLMIIF